MKYFLQNYHHLENKCLNQLMLDELQVIRERLNGFAGRPIQQGPGFLIMNFVLGVTVGHILDSDMEYGVFVHEMLNKSGAA